MQKAEGLREAAISLRRDAAKAAGARRKDLDRLADDLETLAALREQQAFLQPTASPRP
jgi:hypothetical protein